MALGALAALDGVRAPNRGAAKQLGRRPTATWRGGWKPQAMADPVYDRIDLITFNGRCRPGGRRLVSSYPDRAAVCGPNDDAAALERCCTLKSGAMDAGDGVRATMDEIGEHAWIISIVGDFLTLFGAFWTARAVLLTSASVCCPTMEPRVCLLSDNGTARLSVVRQWNRAENAINASF